MATPSTDDMELAADWLESNEGEEGADLRRVAAWLRQQVEAKLLRDQARKHRVPVAALRKRLTQASPVAQDSPAFDGHGLHSVNP
jgi:hypothetical protein